MTADGSLNCFALMQKEINRDCEIFDQTFQVIVGTVLSNVCVLVYLTEDFYDSVQSHVALVGALNIAICCD